MVLESGPSPPESPHLGSQHPETWSPGPPATVTVWARFQGQAGTPASCTWPEHNREGAECSLDQGRGWHGVQAV